MFREGFVDVHGVPTHVLTCGGWLDAAPSTLVWCVSGNPGLGGYYRDFLGTLHSLTGLPVWLASHAGHYSPSPSESPLPLPPLKSGKYDLEGQVAHKKAFLAAHVPPTATLHLVGHSIGCWVLLQLLKDAALRKRTVRAHLLFPTVERMAVTPNGRFLTRMVLPVAPAVVLVSNVFTWLPRSFQRLLLRGFFLIRGRRDLPEAIETTVRLIDPPVLARVFHLAADEMEKVVGLDAKALEEFGGKLHFYYGTTDGWAPLSYCEDLRARFPDLWVDACDLGLEHAFVLGAGKVVGGLVAKWILADVRDPPEE